MPLLTLSDGRLLHYEVTGADDGPVLVYHHGTPGSGRPMRGMAREAATQGARLVFYSRAGYSDSSRNAGRRVVDVVGDIEQLMDHLDVDRFMVAGKSGGGPHALATGAMLADRVSGVCSIAGVGPFGVAGLDFLAGQGSENVVEFSHAMEGESALRPYLDHEAVGLRAADVAGMITQLQTVLPQVDRDALTDEYGEDQLGEMQEGLRLAVDGWLDDDLAFTRDWGFELATITVPTFIWQGSADLMVPFAHGEWLVEAIPGATAHLLADEGHLSIAEGAFDRMLTELLGTV